MHSERALMIPLFLLIVVGACGATPARPKSPGSAHVGVAIIAAAREGRCAAAVTMLDTLRGRDRAYREEIADDDAVRRCQGKPPLPPSGPVRVRYASQIAMRDGIALALVAVAGAIGLRGHAREDTGGMAVAETLLPVAAGLYVLGGPIAHLQHRNLGASAKSLALRVGLPLLASVPLMLEAAHGGGSSASFGLVVVGAGVAVVVDWLVLAVERERRQVTPVVAPTTGGATVGLAWSF